MKKIRGVGLAVLMVAALTAYPAAASASGGIVADDYPASLQAPASNFTLITTGTFGCSGFALTSALDEPSSGFSANVGNGTGCGTGFKMNGCKFEFHPGSKSFDIGPSGCGPITLAGVWGCKMSINPQTGLAATYENTGSGSSAGVKVNAQAKIKYTTTEWSVGCGPAGTHTLSFYGAWNLTGADSEEAPVGIRSVSSGDLPVGMFLAPSEYGYDEFSAQAFPVAVKGERAPEGELVLFRSNGEAKCASVQLTGPELSEAAETVSVGAEYGGCTVFGTSATVKMNSCRYELSAGRPEVACSKEGDAIEVNSAMCSLKMGPQPMGGAEYSNKGSGSASSIEARLAGTGVQVTKAGTFCFLFTGTSGVADLDFNLYGVR